MKLLVCMLEFPTWKLAKPWSYISGYAFVDAMRELGHDVELVLLFNLAEAGSHESALELYERRDERFDCAFFWMPHLDYSDHFWEMAERIARRRVGVFIESLRYTLEEIRDYPDLAQHYTERSQLRTRWRDWLGHCTHVVTMDYHDFCELRQSGYSVFWTPGIVPKVPEETFLDCGENSDVILTAATIYGKRQALHQYLTAHGIVDAGEGLRHSPALIAEFESAVVEMLSRRPGAEAAVSQGSERVRSVRLQLWYEYLRHISTFAGIISLPAYFKGFPGRVLEGMLAGCAVLIFEAFDLTRQKKIFLPRENIQYLAMNPGERELDRIVEIIRDRPQRRRIVEATRERAVAMCDSTIVVEAMMAWVETDEGRIAHDRLGRALRRVLSAVRLNQRTHVEIGHESC
jgi:hypothetical protein